MVCNEGNVRKGLILAARSCRLAEYVGAEESVRHG